MEAAFARENDRKGPSPKVIGMMPINFDHSLTSHVQAACKMCTYIYIIYLYRPFLKCCVVACRFRDPDCFGYPCVQSLATLCVVLMFCSILIYLDVTAEPNEPKAGSTAACSRSTTPVQGPASCLCTVPLKAIQHGSASVTHSRSLAMHRLVVMSLLPQGVHLGSHQQDHLS